MMKKEEYEKMKKDLILPKVTFAKGKVKKTILGEDGKSYEIEKIIELPVNEQEEK